MKSERGVRARLDWEFYRARVQFSNKENRSIGRAAAYLRCEAVCSVNLVLLWRAKHFRQNKMRSSGNPGIRFRSEVPDNAGAGENIVLAVS